MDQSVDEKPSQEQLDGSTAGAEQSEEPINVRVSNQNGKEVQFKIKRHTGLKKLMSTYCEKEGLSVQALRFTFDGNRIRDNDTPKTMGMEDGDTIEVFGEQIGGSAEDVLL